MARPPGSSVAAMAVDRSPRPCAIVIFGATGDLAHRKLFPALASLASRGRLPARCAVIGVARTVMSDDDFAAEVRRTLEKNAPDRATALDDRGVHFRYVVGSYDRDATFETLAKTLGECDEQFGTGHNRLYYLATVPGAFATIAEKLGAAGLHEQTDGTFVRIVVEKPFGDSEESAEQLDWRLHRWFHERQIFRIDHYLAKETVQNVLALRLANTIFEPIWNRRYVANVQVTVAEEAGVGHRSTFYEHAGATRDVLQNHVLQVLAVTTMETPASFEAEAVRDEKVKLLRSIRPFASGEAAGHVVRGQYTAGVVDGEPVGGYLDEVGVAAESRVETFVALRLDVDNWRWAGVPFFVRTGKRLARRVTEVVIRFRPVPFLPLPSSAVESLEPNSLVLRLQPDEGVSLSFAAKAPGSPFRVRTVELDFDYRERFGGEPPEAYERVLADAIIGDATLFIRTDEVQAAWRVIDPVLGAFASDSVPLYPYASGTWGPEAADALVRASGDRWCTA